MKKSQVLILVQGSPEKVIAHAKYVSGKKQLSMSYKGERNPRKALILAELEKKGRGILEKYPKTQEEYWATIEALGGQIWFFNHELADGRVKSTPEIEKELQEMQALSEELVSELSRFGIVRPRDCPKTMLGEEEPKAPKGKKWYWTWYYEMKDKSYAAEYEKLICSACSLSEGVESFISLGGDIPCSVFQGSLYRLSAPYSCAMIGSAYSWSSRKLFAQIRKVGGPEAVAKFRAKEEKLKKAAEAFKKTVAA